jgi:hypothetical protein
VRSAIPKRMTKGCARNARVEWVVRTK